MTPTPSPLDVVQAAEGSELRYEPRTEHRRAGELAVFAYQWRSRWQRAKDWLGLGG